MRNKARISSLLTAVSQIMQQDKKINNILDDKKKKMELINAHNKASEENLIQKGKQLSYITAMNKQNLKLNTLLFILVSENEIPMYKCDKIHTKYT